jgi:hypothetical protein
VAAAAAAAAANLATSCFVCLYRARRSASALTQSNIPTPPPGHEVARKGGPGMCCCIMYLLPAAWCLVHAARNKSARAGATAAGARHVMRHRRRRCSAKRAQGARAAFSARLAAISRRKGHKNANFGLLETKRGAAF